MSQFCKYIDLLTVFGGLGALVLVAAIGWIVARSQFRRRIAELNTSLVLERRVNKQLSEAIEVNALRSLVQASALTASHVPVHEPTLSPG